jgi:hypothetical protein
MKPRISSVLAGTKGRNPRRIRLNVAFRYVAQWSGSASTEP